MRRRYTGIKEGTRSALMTLKDCPAKWNSSARDNISWLETICTYKKKKTVHKEVFSFIRGVPEG